MVGKLYFFNHVYFFEALHRKKTSIQINFKYSHSLPFEIKRNQLQYNRYLHCCNYRVGVWVNATFLFYYRITCHLYRLIVTNCLAPNIRSMRNRSPIMTRDDQCDRILFNCLELANFDMFVDYVNVDRRSQLVIIISTDFSVFQRSTNVHIGH